MANRPHPDKQAVTWRLHRNLIERVKTTADGRGETVVSFVARALENEIERVANQAQDQTGEGIRPPGGASLAEPEPLRGISVVKSPPGRRLTNAEMRELSAAIAEFGPDHAER